MTPMDGAGGEPGSARAGLPRVLFVDDEQSALAALRRMLHSHRHRWDISFATGAVEALPMLEGEPYDVIVSDYQMPDMDGAELLQVVRARYPGTARIILSGTAEEDRLLKVVLISHQFLNKPCRTDDLVQAMERVLALRSALADSPLRSDITAVGSLPSPSGVLTELSRALESADASGRSVARVVERDPATTAKVLKVVNSAVSGTNRRIGNVGQAVALLGLRVVHALVLFEDLLGDFPLSPSVPKSWLERLTCNARETAQLARLLAGEAPWAEEAFTAGLLGESGLLLLAACRPEMFAVHQAAWSASGGPLSPIEVAAFGADHAAIGAHLLNLWGLPGSVTGAVTGHTTTETIDHPTDLVSTVALAHALVEIELGPLCGRHDGGPPVDTERLDSTVRAQFDSWRRNRNDHVGA